MDENTNFREKPKNTKFFLELNMINIFMSMSLDLISLFETYFFTIYCHRPMGCKGRREGMIMAEISECDHLLFKEIYKVISHLSYYTGIILTK